MDEHALLAEFCREQRERREAAFRAIVDAYVDVVFAAARRHLHGDAHLAEDVTQAVFMTLARKAASVPAHRPLSAWLLKVTAYAAANARRAAVIRQTHEREAAAMARSSLASGSDSDSDWQDVAPLLDRAVASLKSAERDALLLKYFDRKPLREIAARLGISEDAAAKRVSRGVERLRTFFRRHGVGVSSVVLASVLATRATEAAPASLSATAAAAALAGPTGAAASTSAAAAAIMQGAMLAMATAKAKAALLIIVAILLLVASLGGVVHLMTSSSRRVALVTATPASAIAAPPTSNSPWQAQFPDGSVVEVVAMSERPDDPTAMWWSPDGSKAARPPGGRSGAFVTGGPGERTVCFVLSLTGPATANANVNVSLIGEDGGSAGISQNIIGDVRWVKYVMAMPSNLARADLEVLVSSGPYKQVQRIPVHFPASTLSTATTNPAPRDGDLLVHEITEEKGQTVFRITRNGSDADGPQDEQIVALLASGKEISYSMMRSETFGLPGYYFRAKPSDITALIRRTRLFQAREIHNIALLPAH